MKLFGNNNSKVVHDLTIRSLKTSRMKTFFVVITIILSVLLVAGIGFSSSSMLETYKTQINAMQHVIYNNTDSTNNESLLKDSRVDSMVMTKYGKGMEVENYIVMPVYLEQIETQMKLSKVVEGNYPQALDEIAVDKSYMNRIGKPATIGSTLEFTFLDGTTERFTITGFTQDDVKSDIYRLYLSEEYAQTGSQLKDVAYMTLVRIVGVDSMSKYEFLDVIRELAKDCDIVRYNVNENNYFTSYIDRSAQEYKAVFLIGLAILFISILVIYSIFYISVVSRIQQFGQLRTIGTTPKQIRKMVRLEGKILWLIGTPIGLLLGGLFAYFLSPEGWRWSNIFIISIIIAIGNYITVGLSVQKPAKIASSISPIEALRSSGYVDSKEKESKVLCRKITPFRLAKISAVRNKKKLIMTILSLGVGGILFITGTTFLTSMNKEEFSRQGVFGLGEFNIYISRNAVETNEYGYTGIKMNNPMNDELIQRLRAIDGVKEVTAFGELSITYEYNDYKGNESFSSINREQMDYLQGFLENGEMDYEKMMENNEVIVKNNDVVEEIFGWKFEVGDTIKVRWYNGYEYVEELFTIAGDLSDKVYTDDKAYRIILDGGLFFVPEETLNGLMPEGFNFTDSLVITTDYENGNEERSEEIKAIVAENPLLKLSTLDEMVEADKETFDFINATVFGLSGFIIGFSIINLINTLVTNVMTRKKEFAMLQAVGMSDKQLTFMIQAEGLLLAFWNSLISLILGTGLGYYLVHLLNEVGANYMHYSFPIYYALAYIALTILAPIAISAIVIKISKKNTLVERLK